MGEHATGDSVPPAPSRRWWQLGVRQCFVLIACLAVLAWAARSLRENQSASRKAARALQASDAGERVAAAMDLGVLATAELNIAIPALTSALSDPDPEVRSTAAASLSVLLPESIKRGSEQREVLAARTALLQLLKDGTPVVRFAAARTLADAEAANARRHGAESESGSSPLVDSQLVVESITEVAMQRDPATYPPAFATLTYVTEKIPAAAPAALVTALDDPAAEFREAAALACSNFRRGMDSAIPRLFDHIRHDVPEVSFASYTTLLKLRASPTAVPILITALSDSNRRVRSCAASVLRHIGPAATPAIPKLLDVLGEPLPTERMEDPTCHAAWALGDIAPMSSSAESVIAALIKAFQSGDESRRATAANALERFGSKAAPAVPVLIEALARPTVPDPAPAEFAYAFAHALGEIAPGTRYAKDAIAALTVALRHSSLMARSRAATALAKFGAAAVSAVPSLEALHKEESPANRSAATEALRVIESSK